MDRSKDSKNLVGPQVESGGTAAGGQELSTEAVAAYLRRHPDFLAEHSELLPALTPPELRRGDSIVDMQHFMLQRLRGEVQRLKTQQRALIATSRSNLTSQNRSMNRGPGWGQVEGALARKAEQAPSGSIRARIESIQGRPRETYRTLTAEKDGAFVKVQNSRKEEFTLNRYIAGNFRSKEADAAAGVRRAAPGKDNLAANAREHRPIANHSDTNAKRDNRGTSRRDSYEDTFAKWVSTHLLF